MLNCQKNKFSLSEEYTYLNCATMSPNLKTVEIAGIEAVRMKSEPYNIKVNEFYQPVEQLKKSFARLINVADFERVAIIPSVSYGMGNVVNNIKPGKKKTIIMVDEQFPSNYYVWEKLANKYDLKIKSISASQSESRGADWNQKILEAINDDTVAVTLGHVHWADGTKFDLKAIRQKTQQHDALMIIDGTQSVGAMSFDVQELQPDALIVGGYKWLLGSYGLGLAYYGPYFDGGEPIEENWINRYKSENFQNLVNYQAKYKPKANRYCVGENSNFILIPMLNTAINQLLEWGTESIQEYCNSLITKPIQQFIDMGCQVEDAAYRGNHLFGVRLNNDFDMEQLKAIIAKENIYVSFRGTAVRISPHVYNEVKDFENLIACFETARKKKVYYS
ncbi:MAG TPA: aminotransferase class V-fold PLP-dependent enzyme [Saprospiraceae bacterium]|nr:aminotransferase class V-fold PLP-dependent enzyme [Saprospiraceae bacterium]